MASLRIGMAPATHGQFGMFGPTDRRPWLLWVLATAMWFQTVASPGDRATVVDPLVDVSIPIFLHLYMRIDL